MNLMINKSTLNKYVRNREGRDAKIYERLKADYEYLSKTHEVLGVFLFGSQNYETDLPGSDIDVKAIVMPPIQSLLLFSGEVKETHKRDNGELTVFDIRSMHNYIKKVNVNFLEILFTDFKIINPKYKDIWGEMIILREDIAYHNKRAAMECLFGCAMNKLEKIFKRLPSNEDKIDKVGYDYKALADVHRFHHMMLNYEKHLKYEELLIPYIPFESTRYDVLMKIKSCDYVYEDLDQLRKEVSTLEANIKYYMDQYREKRPAKCDETVLLIIDSITENCLKAYINERCYQERWPVLSY